MFRTRLVMTRDAIHGDSLRVMAVQTKVHREFLGFNRDRALSHIAVAFVALDSVAHVRGMLEHHVNFRIKPEHGLPGDILSLVGISREFLNFRIVGVNGFMAYHAGTHAWNSSIRALSCA